MASIHIQGYLVWLNHTAGGWIHEAMFSKRIAEK